MNEDDEQLTALERQGVDSGTMFFDTEEELQEYMAAFRLEHEAVLEAVAEARGEDEDDISDIDDYDDLLEEP